MIKNDYENMLDISEDNVWRQLYSSEEEMIKSYYEHQKVIPEIFIVIRFIGIFLTLASAISIIKEFMLAPSIFQLPSIILGLPLIFSIFVLFPNAMINNTSKKPIQSINNHTALVKYAPCIGKSVKSRSYQRRTRMFTINCLVDCEEKTFFVTKKMHSMVKVGEDIIVFKYGDKEHQLDIFAKELLNNTFNY